MNTLKDGLLNTGLPEQGLETCTGELPPPKPLEIHSADSNLGGLFPPGSPLLHRYDSHWPGAPFLLVPSDRHDEHYSNKPPSMRHFCSFQMVPSLRAHPRVHIQSPPSPLASNTTPPTQSLSRGCLSFRVTKIPTPMATIFPAYQITRSNVLNEWVTLRV